MYFLLAILLVILPIVICWSCKSSKTNPPKIFGVYSIPKKWYRIKYYAMLCILYLRKYSTLIRKYSMKPTETSEETVEDLEKLQQLSNHEKAFDAVFFIGVSKTDFYFVGGIERRHRAKVNGLVYFVVPEIGLLHSEKLPRTELNADPVALHKMDFFAGGGISFTPIKPMKTWKISHEGQMWSGTENKKIWYDVTFEAEFTSSFPHFNVDTDTDKKILAKALAKETWSREFFELLENAHQTHYEQMGFIKGSLKVDGTLHEIDLLGFRDHSFGYKRDWTMLHRYIYHTIHLYNGIRIACGVISHPSSISLLQIGYVLYPNKIVCPIQSLDLELYQHGEGGTLPNELAFTIKADDEYFDCKIKYLHNSVHYKGNDHEAKLHERFFACEVNGMKGSGVSEWQYNNVGTYKLKA